MWESKYISSAEVLAQCSSAFLRHKKVKRLIGCTIRPFGSNDFYYPAAGKPGFKPNYREVIKKMMLKIAGIQMEPFIMDKNRNLTRCLELMGTAAKEGARLMVFPEATLSGYVYNS